MLEGLEPAKNRAYTCKVELLRGQLDAEDYEILLTALADTQKWGAKTLQKALRERGVLLADTTITRHRQNACACFRELD